MIMVLLKRLPLLVSLGVLVSLLGHSVDEKFTLMKYGDIEVNFPTFDPLLNKTHPKTAQMVKGIYSFKYLQEDFTSQFFPKDGFLMDLFYQYSNYLVPFMINNTINTDLPRKIQRIIFLESLGIKFSSKSLLEVTDKEMDAKVDSLLPEVTDHQLRRFYGTIVIEELLDKNKTLIVDLSKNNNYYEKDLFTLLKIKVGESIRYLDKEFKVKKIILSHLNHLKKEDIHNKKQELRRRIGRPIYREKEYRFRSHHFSNHEAVDLLKFSSSFPVVTRGIKVYDKLLAALYSREENPITVINRLKNIMGDYNEYCRSISSEDLKKDRNATRLVTLAHIFFNEFYFHFSINFEALLRGQDIKGLKALLDSIPLERIKPLEALKGVQYPVSLHLLLAQLYQEKNDPKVEEEIRAYLTKGGLSHVSYLPLTGSLVEERVQKVQKVLDGLKVRSGLLQKLLEESKGGALKKVRS